MNPRTSTTSCSGRAQKLVHQRIGDPNDLLGVFKALRLKEGFALHAYDFRSGGKGNGIIWAVPADAPLISPQRTVPGSKTRPRPHRNPWGPSR